MSTCVYPSLQVNESLESAIDTTQELQRQQESLDRSNRMLDRMDEDLTQSKRAMRIISSPFGGIANYFARDGKKKNKAAVESQKTGQSTSKPSSSSSSSSRQTSSSWQDQQQSMATRRPYESSGNTVVDDNLDEVERCLAQMKRVGLEIGNQLDHSIATIDELDRKVTDRDGKIIDLNRKIGRKIG